MFTAEFKRRVQISWSYRFNVLSNVVMWLLIFPIMMLMFGGLSENYVYRSDGIGASLLGYLIWYGSSGVSRHIVWLSSGFSEGSIGRVFISPRLPVVIVVTRLCTMLLMAFIEATLIGLPLIFIYQIDFQFSWITIPLFILSIISLVGIGIGFSGLLLMFKQISSFVTVIFLVALFATGAILPLDMINEFVFIEYLLPPALSISMLRDAVLNGVWMYDEFVALCVQSGCYFIFGLLLFQWCWRQAMTSGNLTLH